MVRLATSVLAASLLVLPALAAPSQQYERSVAESDLYGRDLSETIVTREDLEEMYGREYMDDLEERSPLGIGLIFKGIKALTHLGHHAPSLGSNNNNHRREFDEEELNLRDLDDMMVTREDLDELYGRSPLGIGLIFKGIKALTHLGHHAPSLGSNNNNHRREFDEEELDLRDFDEDLEAREPVNIERILHHAHQAYAASQYIPQSNNRRDFEEDRFERDFDDEEFLAREYYDDLD